MLCNPLCTDLWTAQKATAGATAADPPYDYADPKMKIVLIPAADDLEATLHSGEEEANHEMEGVNCTDAMPGEVLQVASPSSCYNLNFDGALWQSLWKINTAGTSHVSIFAEHFPTEFERDEDDGGAHYLKDDHGDDIEPVHTIPEQAVASSDDTPWGEAIGAAVLVNICTWIGVLFLVPVFQKVAKANINAVLTLSSAFAAGALMSAAFYLMLYEATHLIKKAEEADATAFWGSMILLGFMTAPTLEFIGMMVVPSMKPKKSAPTDTEKAVVETFDASVVDPMTQKRVLIGVLLGDFMHNLVDGMIMGAAFKGCSSSKAWGITAATVEHELAQEISDFFVLTNPSQGGLKPWVALVVNFISGLSVCLGVVIMLGSDIGNTEQGAMLAYGGGIYIQIAACECMPRIFTHAKSIQLRAGNYLMFFVGAMAIGLVLLKHEHCEAESDGGGGGHEGHGH